LTLASARHYCAAALACEGVWSCFSANACICPFSSSASNAPMAMR